VLLKEHASSERGKRTDFRSVAVWFGTGRRPWWRQLLAGAAAWPVAGGRALRRAGATCQPTAHCWPAPILGGFASRPPASIPNRRTPGKEVGQGSKTWSDSRSDWYIDRGQVSAISVLLAILVALANRPSEYRAGATRRPGPRSGSKDAAGSNAATANRFPSSQQSRVPERLPAHESTTRDGRTLFPLVEQSPQSAAQKAVRGGSPGRCHNRR